MFLQSIISTREFFWSSISFNSESSLLKAHKDKRFKNVHIILVIVVYFGSVKQIRGGLVKNVGIAHAPNR